MKIFLITIFLLTGISNYIYIHRKVFPGISASSKKHHSSYPLRFYPEVYAFCRYNACRDDNSKPITPSSQCKALLTPSTKKAARKLLF
jgi:hypothetical protein